LDQALDLYSGTVVPLPLTSGTGRRAGNGASSREELSTCRWKAEALQNQFLSTFDSVLGE
jgi:hypothetical protein